MNINYTLSFKLHSLIFCTIIAVGIATAAYMLVCVDNEKAEKAINSGRDVEEFPEVRPAGIDPDYLFIQAGVPTLIVGTDRIEILHDSKRLTLDFSGSEINVNGDLKYDEAAKTFIDALAYYKFNTLCAPKEAVTGNSVWTGTTDLNTLSFPIKDNAQCHGQTMTVHYTVDGDPFAFVLDFDTTKVHINDYFAMWHNPITNRIYIRQQTPQFLPAKKVDLLRISTSNAMCVEGVDVK